MVQDLSARVKAAPGANPALDLPLQLPRQRCCQACLLARASLTRIFLGAQNSTSASLILAHLHVGLSVPVLF